MIDKKFSLVVAIDGDGGIGIDGKLPWRLKGDMKHFREVTTGDGNNAVIMGRSTWESIPGKFRPLPNRYNIVMTRNEAYMAPREISLAASLDAALVMARQSHKVFVIGGGQIYAEALNHPGCEGMLLTRVADAYDCDTFFPPYEKSFRLSETLGDFSEGVHTYSIERWART
jgi:dihydrofolate reductase